MAVRKCEEGGMHTGISSPVDQCPSAPNHHLSSICASSDFAKAASDNLVLCWAWSRLSTLCEPCIYIELKAAGNLSIFNKADGGQINCCFQSHFSLSEQGCNKKRNNCFLSGFSLKFTKSFEGSWGENGCRVFPSMLLLTILIHLIIICTNKPYAIPSVQLQSNPWARHGY